MWHAKVASLTLRLYENPGGYERREPYIATAQVEFMGRDSAFVHAMLRRDGAELDIRLWRGLVDLLREQYGVRRIYAERRGELVKVFEARNI